VVLTRRNLRDGFERDGDIALVVDVVSPDPDGSILPQCHGEVLTSRNLRGCAEVAGNVALAVGVVSPGPNNASGQGDAVIATRSDLRDDAKICRDGALLAAVVSPCTDRAALLECHHVATAGCNLDDRTDVRDARNLALSVIVLPPDACVSPAVDARATIRQWTSACRRTRCESGDRSNKAAKGKAQQVCLCIHPCSCNAGGLGAESTEERDFRTESKVTPAMEFLCVQMFQMPDFASFRRNAVPAYR
jgi:hypothetical protein